MSLEDYQALAAEAVGCLLDDSHKERESDDDNQQNEKPGETENLKVSLPLGAILPFTSDSAVEAISNRRRYFIENYLKSLEDDFTAEEVHKYGSFINGELERSYLKNIFFGYQEYINTLHAIPDMKAHIKEMERLKKSIQIFEMEHLDKLKRSANSLTGLSTALLPLAQKRTQMINQYEHLEQVQKNRWGTIGNKLAAEVIRRPDLYPATIRGYTGYLYKFAEDFFNQVLAVPAPIKIPEADRMRHSYITGGSGSGKSELLRLMAYHYSRTNRGYCATVIVEPHGDLAEQVARFKHFGGGSSDLVYIDPNLKTGYTPSFNPLTLPQGVDPDVYAQQLVSVFEQLLEGNGGTSLTLNMQALLLPCLKILLEYEGATLLDLHRMMQQDERNRKYVELGKASDNPITSDFFCFEFLNSKWTPTKNAISTKISSLINTKTEQAMFLNASTFDIEDIIENRRTLVLKFSKGQVGESSAKTFGRFIIAALQGIAMRRANLPENEPFTLQVSDMLMRYDELLKSDADGWQETINYQLATYYRKESEDTKTKTYADSDESKEKGASSLDEMEF